MTAAVVTSYALSAVGLLLSGYVVRTNVRTTRRIRRMRESMAEVAP